MSILLKTISHKPAVETDLKNMVLEDGNSSKSEY